MRSIRSKSVSQLASISPPFNILDLTRDAADGLGDFTNAIARNILPIDTEEDATDIQDDRTNSIIDDSTS